MEDGKRNEQSTLQENFVPSLRLQEGKYFNNLGSRNFPKFFPIDTRHELAANASIRRFVSSRVSKGGGAFHSVIDE